MKNAVEVRVGNAVRKVSVEVLGPKYSKGYVGKAFFCWRSDLYDLPYVRIKGRVANDRTRWLVKLFIEEYKRMLLMNKKSPLHFNKHKGDSQSTASGKDRSISGVPYWMREEHKVWTKCFKKDGSSYYRRTRFKPESRGIVEKYLQHCSKCLYRVNCETPCRNPEVVSRQTDLRDKITAIIKHKTKERITTAFDLNIRAEREVCPECNKSHDGPFFSGVKVLSIKELLEAIEDYKIEEHQIKNIRAVHHEELPVGRHNKETMYVYIELKERKEVCYECKYGALEVSRS